MADKINLNTASADEIDRIPNLGRDCAERVISEREKRGGFKSLDELDQIGGFGEEAIRNLKQHASL